MTESGDRKTHQLMVVYDRQKKPRCIGKVRPWTNGLTGEDAFTLTPRQLDCQRIARKWWIVEAETAEEAKQVLAEWAKWFSGMGPKTATINRIKQIGTNLKGNGILRRLHNEVSGR